jgi:hypothetical protein
MQESIVSVSKRRFCRAGMSREPQFGDSLYGSLYGVGGPVLRSEPQAAKGEKHLRGFSGTTVGESSALGGAPTGASFLE